MKPIQCVMFPLFPESIENDYFYVKGEGCKCKNKSLMSVDEWLNGNNNIYNKNKKTNYLWVKAIEEIQFKWKELSEENKNKIKFLLYEKYDFSKKNIDKQIQKNIKEIYKILD